jgi:hypothetical protein
MHACIGRCGEENQKGPSVHMGGGDPAHKVGTLSGAKLGHYLVHLYVSSLQSLFRQLPESAQLLVRPARSPGNVFSASP